MSHHIERRSRVDIEFPREYQVFVDIVDKHFDDVELINGWNTLTFSNEGRLQYRETLRLTWNDQGHIGIDLTCFVEGRMNSRIARIFHQTELIFSETKRQSFLELMEDVRALFPELRVHFEERHVPFHYYFQKQFMEWLAALRSQISGS